MADIINAQYRQAFGRKSALSWLLWCNGLIFVALRLIAAMGNLSGHPQWIDLSLSALSLPADPATAFAAPCTWFTYMVTQYSPSHLIFNLLWLAWFGMFLQSMCGNRIFLSVYVSGGLIGALSFLSWAATVGGPGAGLIGSSASVMAVAVAITAIHPNSRVWVFFGFMKLKWVAAIMIAIALIFFSGNNPGTDFAHLGGAIAGLAAAALYHIYRRHTAHIAPGQPASATVQTASASLSDTELLNLLLDKIRRSGFDSLSQSERSTLFNLSRRLKQ
ncbi:MAG: rhomboid family intramembrane serine protease [Firmicutes bacterium]|nr:rhomboid family intramembrane serine protease [Bacillota bacterium]MCM1400997.1 rhomboid family intramembrane serine protease [Bacteroides sp.]MCM1476524.1 rhomboid family intramembrane serine protease [Bacteroides sp.]